MAVTSVNVPSQLFLRSFLFAVATNRLLTNSAIPRID